MAGPLRRRAGRLTDEPVSVAKKFSATEFSKQSLFVHQPSPATQGNRWWHRVIAAAG